MEAERSRSNCKSLHFIGCALSHSEFAHVVLRKLDHQFEGTPVQFMSTCVCVVHTHTIRHLSTSKQWRNASSLTLTITKIR